MHVVEKLRGQGLVLRSNHLPLHGIGYNLTIWREPLRSAAIDVRRSPDASKDAST